ncbi:MAG: enoyl-CoA hydratase [Alphaproteobacteria bacterium]|nr:enoyl-CoA hydratase [Alphaproteobacteria bacterium]
MTDQELLIRCENRVGIIALNRPDQMNALTDAQLQRGVEVLQEFASDPGVGAVVVTGEGRAFCAGGDVAVMQTGEEFGPAGTPVEAQIETLRSWHRFPLLLNSMPKPTIAVVNGAAVGGGLGLALACDLRFASDKAKFGTAYARVGYDGDFGTTWQMTRLLGEAKAKELFFLPDILSAQEALRIGMVNRVFPHDELMTEAMAIAGRVAAGPSVSYRYMKANVAHASTVDFATSLNREAETHIRCGQTEDHAEGVNAFLEKREPVFQGK